VLGDDDDDENDDADDDDDEGDDDDDAQVAAGYHFIPGDIQWSPVNTIKYPLICVTAGASLSAILTTEDLVLHTNTTWG
jgi:hypothetical protein